MLKGSDPMKRFLGIFALLFVLGWVFMFFGGVYLIQNFWGTLALIALILALFITLLVRQEERIDALEARVAALENAAQQD